MGIDRLKSLIGFNTIKFPDDFESCPHAFGVIPSYRGEKYDNAMKYGYPSLDDPKISVVFGSLFYSNGIDTYEMWDMREKKYGGTIDPAGYLTIKEINNHLKKNPIKIR